MKNHFLITAYLLVSALFLITPVIIQEFLTTQQKTRPFGTGAKWYGLFYFRPEVGYMFGFAYTVRVLVDYFDGSSVTRKEQFTDEIPKGQFFNIRHGLFV